MTNHSERKQPAEFYGDCYSKGEREWMSQTQRYRERLFGPLLKLLERFNVAPDHLTLLSLFAGLTFCPLYFWSIPAAFAALMLHAALDGLDGPLARHLGVASRSGSFTDTMTDQLVVTATTIALMKAGVIGIAAGSNYIFLYGVVVAFAMIRNALAVPYSWIVRPRFIVYLWLPVEAYLLPGTIDYLLWFCSALLALKMLTGFFRIRKTL